MPGWLLVALTIGAIMRLTRVVTADYITKPIRDRLTRKWGEDSKRAYLIECDYCASFWIAPPVAAVVVAWPDNRVVWVILIALTASFIAGIIAAHE
jgi:hypothetical protein